MLAALAVTGVVSVLAGVPSASAVTEAWARRASRRVPRRPTRHPRVSWSSARRGCRGPTSTVASLPALDALAKQGALGSLTVRAVRSRACAVDGWLTLSAGRRAADAPGPCREPLPVVDGSVPRWAEYVAAAGSESYDARPGSAR